MTITNWRISFEAAIRFATREGVRVYADWCRKHWVWESETPFGILVVEYDDSERYDDPMFPYDVTLYEGYDIAPSDGHLYLFPDREIFRNRWWSETAPAELEE